MGQEVAVFVNRAALDRQILAPQPGECGFEARRAVGDDERRPPRDCQDFRAVGMG